jgi:hypothetical protein
LLSLPRLIFSKISQGKPSKNRCSDRLELAEAPQYFEVIYLPKYFQIFSYFISKNSKNVGLSLSNTNRDAVPYKTKNLPNLRHTEAYNVGLAA